MEKFRVLEWNLGVKKKLQTNQIAYIHHRTELF
jgi:hypothetical protein